MQIVRARSLDHHLKHVRVHDCVAARWGVADGKARRHASPQLLGLVTYMPAPFQWPHACERVPHIMSDTCELVKMIGSVVASTT